MFNALIMVLLLSTVGFALGGIFTMCEQEIGATIILAIISVLCLASMLIMFEIDADDIENIFLNESRHSTIIAQVIEVSEDYILLQGGQMFHTTRMSDKSPIKDVNIYDVVEIVYFTSKTKSRYIYSIKELAIEDGK